MKCPTCGCDADRVVDSRNSKEGKAIRRRRECLHCARRFTTYEYIESSPVTIVKNDGRREPFTREKLLEGLVTACKKRPVSTQQLQQLVDSIESQLQSLAEPEVTSQTVGHIAMLALREIDEVAYVRFASVYRKFKEAKEFLSELKVMSKEDAPAITQRDLLSFSNN